MRIAVLGGDARQWEAARVLASAGYEVRVFGLRQPDGSLAGGPQPSSGPPAEGRQPVVAASAQEAVAGAGAVVGPVQGALPTGAIWTQPGLEPVVLSQEDLAGLAPGAIVLMGMANEPFRRLCREVGVDLFEYRDEDDFALLNAIPSAEGAIAMAMEMTSFTLFGSCCFVLGLGRTGEILALMLKGIGAKTFVAARRPEALARVEAHGHQAIPFAELERAIGQAQVVFNTAPAPILYGKTLEALQRGTVIIDLASAPGGTDFEAAKVRGIKAVLAPGLPGKVAPESAGRYVAQLVVRTLKSRPPVGREEGGRQP